MSQPLKENSLLQPPSGLGNDLHFITYSKQELIKVIEEENPEVKNRGKHVPKTKKEISDTERDLRAQLKKLREDREVLFCTLDIDAYATGMQEKIDDLSAQIGRVNDTLWHPQKFETKYISFLDRFDVPTLSLLLSFFRDEIDSTDMPLEEIIKCFVAGIKWEVQYSLSRFFLDLCNEDESKFTSLMLQFYNDTRVPYDEEINMAFRAKVAERLKVELAVGTFGEFAHGSAGSGFKGPEASNDRISFRPGIIYESHGSICLQLLSYFPFDLEHNDDFVEFFLPELTRVMNQYLNHNKVVQSVGDGFIDTFKFSDPRVLFTYTNTSLEPPHKNTSSEHKIVRLPAPPSWFPMSLFPQRIGQK